MNSDAGAKISELTTFGVGGTADNYVAAFTQEEVIKALQGKQPMLVIAGGSNLLVSDDGFRGQVVHIQTRGIEFGDDGTVVVEAGEPWDALVQATIDNGLSGFECLSGIPGSSGATPVQNVGAYGEEIANTFVSLRAYDRINHEIVEFNQTQCNFGYRTSVFKRNDRYVILSVTFRLQRSEMSVPIRYSELARTLGVNTGDCADISATRDAVLQLRSRKGMVLDASDPDTRSAGSFFTNPVINENSHDWIELAPTWPQPDGKVKVSAAWLIEQAGFTKGYTKANARLSTKHTLALTNFNHGRATDLIALAKEVQDGVSNKFGVLLHPEPVLVGVEI